ncbi:hypothetical protein ACFPES_30380 [Paenibacillus sp. GCM10023248]|nr:hypothetical protein [Paenibacillus sp. MAHUQ-63]
MSVSRLRACTNKGTTGWVARVVQPGGWKVRRLLTDTAAAIGMQPGVFLLQRTQERLFADFTVKSARKHANNGTGVR